MANDNDSGSIHERGGRITRSATHTLSKKLLVSPSSSPNRKSERLEKRPPSTQSPLRRSDRIGQPSPSDPNSKSSGSKKHQTTKPLSSEAVAEERATGASSNRKIKRMDARVYRASLKKPNRGYVSDHREESSSKNRSTHDGDDANEGNVGKCLKENRLDLDKDDKGILPSEDAKAEEMRNESGLSAPMNELLENNVTQNSSVPSNAKSYKTSGAPERVQSDCCGEETSQMSRDSTLNEKMVRKCVGQDKDKKLTLTYSKRKRTKVDMDSNVSATLADDDNCNLVADAAPSRLCDNIVETSGSCSKRIRPISLSDIQKDSKTSTNNVDSPSAKSNGENLSTRNKEGKSGDPAERCQGNDVETEKIRKEQKSLHLLLKPEIAKLCEILLLPDNVKIMVEKCLEHTINNYQICTEPESILQAFQLSLCWAAAALLNHKFDLEASLILAKRHLKFDCDKKLVKQINLMLWNLRENFLLLRGNSSAIGSPKASNSSNMVSSHTKDQWGKLLQMQQEEKHKLENDIEKEKVDFKRRCKIEWMVIQSRSTNNVTSKEKDKHFSRVYGRRVGELNRHHEIRLKDLEVKHLEARQKFQESLAPDELLNLVAPKELETSVKYWQTDDQAQPHNAQKSLLSDHVAKRKCFDDIAEAKTRIESGVGLSEAPDTYSSLVVSCNSTVKLQTLVKHSGADEVDNMASKKGSVSGNKCHNTTENEYGSHGIVVSKSSNSREKCFDGATNIADEGCQNFSGKSHNDCGQDTVANVQLSSNEEMYRGEKSDVPSGKVALAVHETRSSNDELVGVPFSGQEKLDGTITSKPVLDLSIEGKANGFSDDVINMASNSKSQEDHIPTENTMCIPNCDNAAQVREADDSNGLNDADSMDSPLSNQKISSLNSKSPQENFPSVDVTCMPTRKNSIQICEDDDGNGSNNVATLNSPLIDEGIVDGTTTSVTDTEVHVEISGFTPPSMEQISGGAVNASILGNVLSSPCEAVNPINNPDAEAVNPSNSPNAEAANPSNSPDDEAVNPGNSPDGNAIILSNQSSLDNDDVNGVSSSIPARQIPVEVSEANREGATVSVLPGTVCTDHQENVSPLNSSSHDQVYDGGSVLGGDLSPKPSCTASPSNGQPATSSYFNPPLQQQIPDTVLLNVGNEQIPDTVPENGHEKAERLLTDGVVKDKTIASDQQEGMCRSTTENTLPPETAVSGPVDLRESPEHVQTLSSLESPIDQDTSREIHHSLVSTQVHIVPSDQSNHVSTVVEPPEQEQQLPSEGFPSSNQDLSDVALVTGIEDRPTNEDALSNHIPEASPQVQNQAAEQPASNLDLDSLMPGGVRTQPSDMRNWSAPTETNNHPVRIASQSASGIVPPFCHDPLIQELEKIRKLTEENMKKHEYMKLQLKGDFDKEFEELRRKYENKLKEIEVEFQKTGKDLDRQFNTVFVHKLLAEAFRSKSADLKVSGASGMPQDTFMQHLFQVLRHQSASSSSHLPPASSLESLYAATTSRTTVPPIQTTSFGPPAASVVNSYATTTSRTAIPPIQPTYNTTGIFSGVSARPVDDNTICSPSGNPQAGGEIRAPAPHLQSFRPSTFVPPSSLCIVNGIPTQPAPSNIPVNLSLFSHRLHGPMPTGSPSDPHRGLRPPGLPAMDLPMNATSQPVINLPNVVLRMSDLASLNLSKFGTNSSMPANSTQQATPSEVVCLSDDDE